MLVHIFTLDVSNIIISFIVSYNRIVRVDLFNDVIVSFAENVRY